MQNKTKITFAVPESLQKELRQRIIDNNYGMRGKSKWIAEAIEMLLEGKNYPELANIGNEMSGFEKMESILIEPETKNKLDAAILKVRTSYPLLEGVQSRIIRTSIVQRLLRF